MLTSLKSHYAQHWVRSQGGAMPRGWIYGIFALLIVLGLSALKLVNPNAGSGILVIAMAYGVWASAYLLVSQTRAAGWRSLMDGDPLHPKHGLLSSTPRTVLGAAAMTLLCASVAALSLWAMQVEVEAFTVQSADDVAFLYITGVAMLTICAVGYPIGVVDWLVVRRWGTTNPPPQVFGRSLVLSSGLGLIAGWLTVQWAVISMPPGTGWFGDWIGWLPTGLIVGNTLAMSYRHLMVSAWQSKLTEQTLRADGAVQARRLAEAQLATLQAQIEPHFLYNTLASVQFLVRKDAASADFLLTQLIRYLRHAMPRMRQTMSTLQQEFELADAFLQIARVRMGGRLTVQVELAQAFHELPFPPLVIQTLVENALKHGVEPKLGPVHITVSAKLVGDELRLEVFDNGVGFGRAAGTAGSGTGLANIRERLSGIYGEQAQLGIVDLPRGGVQSFVVLRGQSARTGQLHSKGEAYAA